MSFRENREHLARTPGIEAVAAASSHPNLLRVYAGDDGWNPMLDAALDLQRLTEHEVKLCIGKHIVVVQRANDETIAVAFPIGHPIAKSLRRLLRSMGKRVRS
jgi:hypothetical protein